MNERIKELAEQAGAKFEKTNGLSECRQDSLVGDEMQKFAELLVRECAQFIFVLDAEPVSHKSAARMLQEHFGVE